MIAPHGVDSDREHGEEWRRVDWPVPVAGTPISRRLWPAGLHTNRSSRRRGADAWWRYSAGRRFGLDDLKSRQPPCGSGPWPWRSSSWGRPSSVPRRRRRSGRCTRLRSIGRRRLTRCGRPDEASGTVDEPVRQAHPLKVTRYSGFVAHGGCPGHSSGAYRTSKAAQRGSTGNLSPLASPSDPATPTVRKR